MSDFGSGVFTPVEELCGRGESDVSSTEVRTTGAPCALEVWTEGIVYWYDQRTGGQAGEGSIARS
jgi:hypothetical protein